MKGEVKINRGNKEIDMKDEVKINRTKIKK